MCTGVDSGTSLAGELMKTSVLNLGQISTSVMLVVADSQTFRVLLLFLSKKPKNKVTVLLLHLWAVLLRRLHFVKV